MPYDAHLFVPDGEEYNTYAATGVINALRRWPLGSVAVMQDGRRFRFSQAGATLVIGNVIQSAAPISGDVNVTAVAAALAARSISAATTNPTGANFYAEGYVAVSVAPGSGQVYPIDSHPAVAASAVAFALAGAGQQVRVALTTTSRLDFIQNPYANLIQAPVTTLTGAPAGVAVSAPITQQTCWLQTAGLASVLTSGTVVIGEQVITPAGAAGACGPNSAGGSETEVIIGTVMRVAATTAWSDIRIRMD